MVGFEKNVEIVPKEYTVVGSTHISRSFGMTLKVKGLRSILEGLDDEDLLHITNTSQRDDGSYPATQWSVSKAKK